MLAPEYVTGLADASGVFHLQPRRRQHLGLLFASSTRAGPGHPGGPSELLGRGGSIYPVSPGGLYYRVTRHNELLPVVDHFDRYPLQGHKREAFGIWREMVEIKSRFRHPDRERLDELAERLSLLTVSRASPRASRRRPATP